MRGDPAEPVREEEEEGAAYPCPACGATLYGWTAARHPLDGSKIVLDRCEDCRLAVTRAARPPDAELELGILERSGNEIVAPNRRSFQAGIGGAQWAGLEPEKRRLHLNPRSAGLLLSVQGVEVERVRTPFTARGYLGMAQTLVNAFTFRDNYARNVRAGLLRPGDARSRLTFAIDGLVTALVALPMALLALPIELAGAIAGRGGEMRLRTGAAGRP